MQLRYVIRGVSMEPTLSPGDRVLVVPWRRYRVGQLVIGPGEGKPGEDGPMVKRIERLSDRGAWLVGDNRAKSTDSRDLGWIPLSVLRGRVVYRYAPADRVGWLFAA